MNTYNKFAAVYDALISEDVDYAAWRNFIYNICEKYNINKNNYLDLGCGTGNLAIEVCNGFKNSWCVDLSNEMLIIAEEKFRDKKIKARFIQQDITNLNLNNKFDLITCGLDCTNYLVKEGDLNNFFNAVYKHLNDKGVFIFDINSEYKLRNIIGENTFTYNSDEIVYIWDNIIEDEVVEMSLTFFIRDDSNYQRFDEVHLERIYTEKEIDEKLKDNGFKIISKVDNYTDACLTDSSERITYVVAKL